MDRPARPLELIRRRQQRRQALPIALLKDSTIRRKHVETVARTPLHTERRLDHQIRLPVVIQIKHRHIETRTVPRLWLLPPQLDRLPGNLPKDLVLVS
jgi:hypothetical protein